MRRRDGGTDRGAPEMAVPIPVADAGQFPVFGRSGARGSASQVGSRAASGLRPGVIRPPARSWLTDGPTASAQAGALETPDESAARRRSENAAEERREAQRPSPKGAPYPQGRQPYPKGPAFGGAARRSPTPHFEGTKRKRADPAPT
jgi:hypothetical protein